MSNIDKIVADYGTCKKAWEIGLRIESVFWWRESKQQENIELVLITRNDVDKTFLRVSTGLTSVQYSDDEFISAPTAEEIPLPDIDTFYKLDIHISGDLRFLSLYGDQYNDSEIYYIEIKDKNADIEINEATARLKMAIWLIENVPETRKWYVENGLIKPEGNHE